MSIQPFPFLKMFAWNEDNISDVTAKKKANNMAGSI